MPARLMTEYLVQVSCPAKDTENFYAVLGRNVEDEVIPESAHRPRPHTLEPGIGKVADCPHAGHLREFPEISEDSFFVTLGRVKVPLADVDNLLIEIALDLRPNHNAGTHGFPDRDSRS
jgi:hypothetical protein